MRRLGVSGICFLALGLLFLNGVVKAQELQNANVQFELEAYDLAIDSYRAYLEDHPNDEAAMYRLAMAYERVNELIPAARWYEKMFVQNADQPDEVRIAFGKVLRSLGLIDQARELFQSCHEPDWKSTADYLIDGCDMAEYLLKMPEQYQLFLYYPSSPFADFGPAVWKDKLVYASYRELSEQPDNQDFNLFHSPTSKLYVAPADRKAVPGDAEPMGSPSFPKGGIAACSFSEDGKKVLFTRHTFKNNTKQLTGTERGMSVYLADVDEQGDFLNEYALPFNSTDYSVAFACFGEHPGVIYFSANDQGERNQFDLYRVEFDGLNWGEPASLESLNTSGNEVTPFFADGYLYFSSDLIPGMGGYDVFRVYVNNGVPGQVMNMGKGINSIADDLYTIKNKDGEYYVTSNRIGGKGDYDIYVAMESGLPQPETDFLAQGTAIENTEIPREVNLENLTEKGNVNAVRFSDAQIVAYGDNTLAPVNISLEGATMVAYGEVIKSSARVYFIQLASLASTKGNVNRYRGLVEYGNIYRVRKANSYKIRLGYFYGQEEARTILAQVKKEGFRDAFVVEDVLNINELELVVSSYTFSENEKYQKPENESEYKVRLAAYSNPLYFDTEKIKDLGVIEQWSKGEWTIFILSGYSGLESAKSARIKAINRGFTGAEIVRDQNGVLTRVHEN